MKEKFTWYMLFSVKLNTNSPNYYWDESEPFFKYIDQDTIDNEDEVERYNMFKVVRKVFEAKKFGLTRHEIAERIFGVNEEFYFELTF